MPGREGQYLLEGRHLCTPELRSEPRTGITGSDVGVRHVGDSSRRRGRTIDRPVVDEDHPLILRPLHVQLDRVSAGVHGLHEGGHGLLWCTHSVATMCGDQRPLGRRRLCHLAVAGQYTLLETRTNRRFVPFPRLISLPDAGDSATSPRSGVCSTAVFHR
jgi:hypothetical protein